MDFRTHGILTVCVGFSWGLSFYVSFVMWRVERVFNKL